jgi:energy-coupling factor transporter transmembrane protein EcfT
MPVDATDAMPSSAAAHGRLDPRAKLLLLALAGLWSVLLERPAPLAFCAALAVLALCLSGAGARKVLGSLGGLALAVWGFALLQAFFYQQAPRTELAAWRPASGFWRAVLGPDGLALYREGFFYGVTQGLRLVLALGAGLAVAFSTEADELLTGLRFFRVPYGLAFMAVTSLRFLPLLGREAAVAWRAARLRGFSPCASAPWTTGAVAFSLLRPVLASCVRRASVLAASVTTRGFAAASSGQALGAAASLGAASWLSVLLAGAATVALVGAKVLYAAYLHEFFYRAELRGLYEFVRLWL